MKATPALGTMCLVVVLVGLVIVSGFPAKASGDGTRADQIILVVGGQDKMKTRNPLPALANDVWTSDVLGRVYDSLGQSKPDTDELVPYIVKGVDANENGVFDANEYGKFMKDAGTDSLDIVAYYDFNGVYFHDGVQATPGDLFFSYQLQALNPRSNIDLRVLMDKAGKSGSNYTTTRWLFMTLTTKSWQNEPTAGVSGLRIAVRFQLQEQFALFYRSTLVGYTLFPRHVWEDRGYRNDITSTGCTVGTPCTVNDLHLDFGKAIYPETDSRFGQGIPTTETTYKPYSYLKSDTQAEDSAEEWQLTDADVIGTGPFKFDYFNEPLAVALVMKNPLFFTGKDEMTGEMIDPYVATYIHQPYIDGISTTVLATGTLGILALESGRIDFYHWSVAPEYVPELINYPNIRIWSRPEPGFFYLAYNMRRPSVGTWHYGQVDQFDVGLHFRRAIAHLIDKPTVVKDFLQGYGVPGVVPLNPQNVRFYNSSLTGYDFSVAQALAEMDLAHQDALWLSANGGGAEAATWFTKDPGSGMYILPGTGTAELSLWCPNADYDPVRANSCVMIANEMYKLGINVKAKPTAFSTITSMINAHDFDMYILGWRIGGNDPDYFYSFFHSSNAASGQNYGGFNDPTLDYILEESRKELDENRRVQLFKWAEGILAEKLPYDVLYFRTNIEAQRQDRFVDWMPSSGTIWNYWSLLNIKPPSNKRLSVGIEAPSAVASGDRKLISVSVKDQDSNPVESANVTLELTPNYAGNFTDSHTTNFTITGKTNLAGKYTVTLVAGTFPDILNATITATVAYPDFPDAGRSSLIAIYPVGADFLAVTIVLIDTDVANAGDTLHFQVTVTDPLGFEKGDAMVTASLDPSLDPPAGVTPSGGAESTMREITFTAPVASLLPMDENPISLTINANLTGYYNGTATIGIVMVKLYQTCWNGDRIPNDQTCVPRGLPILEIVLVIIVIVVILAVVVTVIRRRT
jgi:ABC-type transport system substrate-binding protein